MRHNVVTFLNVTVKWCTFRWLYNLENSRGNTYYHLNFLNWFKCWNEKQRNYCKDSDNHMDTQIKEEKKILWEDTEGRCIN